MYLPLCPRGRNSQGLLIRLPRLALKRDQLVGARHRLVVPLDQLGLVVPGVEMAARAGAEDHQHPLGLGRESAPAWPASGAAGVDRRANRAGLGGRRSSPSWASRLASAMPLRPPVAVARKSRRSSSRRPADDNCRSVDVFCSADTICSFDMIRSLDVQKFVGVDTGRGTTRSAPRRATNRSAAASSSSSGPRPNASQKRPANLPHGVVAGLARQPPGKQLRLLHHQRTIEQVQRLQRRGRDVAPRHRLAGVGTIELAERGVLPHPRLVLIDHPPPLGRPERLASGYRSCT